MTNDVLQPAASLSAAGRRLFGFAVIADSHLEPESSDDPRAAPRSNRRNRWLVDALAPMRPSFVLHLGDIVHPVPSADGHMQTMVLATRLYAGLDAPVLWTPGNHDIGDKSNPAMPAATVTEQWVDEYVRMFGAPWQVHDAGAIVVLLLNTPLLNAGSAAEAAQRRWFEQALGEARGRRVFVATHYPPFLVSPDEAGHYDNIDPPARYWLLDLLRKHRVEGLFCGHVHNGFYHRLDGTEIYLLPSPSFVRRDYSEIYPVQATEEYGRNDTGKLGCYWVDVYESGHVARWLRTEGREPEPVSGRGDGSTDGEPRLIVPGHPKDPGATPFAVHLRHPWSPIVELPHNPPVDEFARRAVRNDAPLQALWDLGIRHVRIPVGDLDGGRLQNRMEDLVGVGMRFTVFSVGLPDAALLSRLAAARHLVARWECVLPWHEATQLAERVGERTAVGPALMLSDLRSAAIGNVDRPAGKHFTAPGFRVDDIDWLADGLASLPPGVIDAVGFRFDRDDFDDEALARIAAFAKGACVRAVVTWTLMPYGPNDTANDEADARDRVERLCLAAERHPALEFALDDFMDIDRGYFPRVALVDRRADLRAAGRWLRDRRAAEVARAGRTGMPGR